MSLRMRRRCQSSLSGEYTGSWCSTTERNAKLNLIGGKSRSWIFRCKLIGHSAGSNYLRLGDAMAANLGHVLVCRRGWHFIGNYINLNGLVKGLSSWWKQRFCDDIKHILRKWKQPFNRPQSRCRRRWYRITTQSHTRHSVSRWHCHDSYLAPRLLLCLSFHYLLLP